MKLLRSLVVVAVVTSVALVSRPAFSDENTAGLASSPLFAGSGTTGITLATTVGLLPFATTGAVIYFVVVKKDDKGGTTPTGEADAGGGYVMQEEEAEKWVELYLRDHSEQLVTDLSRGEGPTLTDLSLILRIQPENRALFGATLQANASELVPYVNKNTLTRKRAAKFFERMGELLRAEAGLSRDLAKLRG